MTQTVDATLPALDQPVPLDVPSEAFLPPPSVGQPVLTTPPSTPAAPPPTEHPTAAPPLIPAPVAAPAPLPVLSRAPIAAPAPLPVLSPAPAAAPAPAPAFSPAPVAAPAFSPEPAPAPEPEPEPSPAPELTPVAAPAPEPEAAPAPEPEPEPEPAPVAILTGPSAVFSTDAALVPPEHSVPLLPSAAAPAKPSAAPPAPGGTAFDVQDFLSTPGPGRKAPKKKKRSRWLVRLMMVGVLGGGGYMAYLHGPALYDEYFGDGEVDTAVAETAAPLAFPNVTIGAAPIRTAEFTLDGIPGTPGVSYRVTTDFETDVSQVDITRADAPDLQILTYANDAMIRRADGDKWYLLDRGQFPLDGRLERSDWVRLIDEFLPIAIRDQAVIDASTESAIAGVPTRHLSLTLSPRVLESLHGDEALPEPVPPVADPLDLGSTSSTSDSVEPPAAQTGAVAIEVWIDGEGLVRQITGAPQLGAQTITIVRTSAEAWIPTYPAPDEISALTASALVELGV